MTLDTREYHRTFNILGLSGRLPGPAEMARDADSELKEARAKYRGLPDRQALDLLRADKLRNPLPIHDAFEDLGSQRIATRIEEKRDQNFEKFATPWELIWSRLVMYWDSRLTPVVNNSGLVVAYAGDIDYKYFLIDYANQEGPTPITADTGMEQVEVLKRYRLFVGTNAFYGRTDLKPFGSSTITRHSVVTDVYGEVMAYTIGQRVDQSITKVGLLEIWGAFVLARDVLQLVTAVGKTGLRTLIRRPPVPATWASGKTPAVSTGGLLPEHVRHLGRRTLIADEDMASSVKALSLSNAESGFYDVAIHGNSTSFRLLVKTLPNGRRVFRDVSVRDVADVVRQQLAPGDKIRLFSCSVGGTGGPAQQLANELNCTVWAATTTVYKTPTVTPGVIRTAFVPANGGKFNEFLPERGAVSFNGGKGSTNELHGVILPGGKK